MEKIRLCILFMYVTTYAADIIESSYYGKLNVPLSLTNGTLRHIFLQQTKKLHPDKNNGLSTEQFQEFMRMYSTLQDDQLREEYNNQLAEQLLQTNNSYAHTIAAQLQKKISLAEHALNLILCCIDCFDSEEETEE